MGFFSGIIDRLEASVTDPLGELETSLTDPGQAISDAFEPITGEQAAQRAAEAQARAAQDAIDFQNETEAQVRSDLEPFSAAGRGALPGLADLINNPASQAEFLQNNPFFKAIADDAERSLLNSQAARGKLGSGETAKLLQNKILLLGNQLLSRNINQRFNVGATGQSAAAGQASGALQSGASVGDLLTQLGGSQAAGILGSAQSRNNVIGGIAGAAGQIGARNYTPQPQQPQPGSPGNPILV